MLSIYCHKIHQNLSFKGLSINIFLQASIYPWRKNLPGILPKSRGAYAWIPLDSYVDQGIYLGLGARLPGKKVQARDIFLLSPLSREPQVPQWAVPVEPCRQRVG